MTQQDLRSLRSGVGRQAWGTSLAEARKGDFEVSVTLSQGSQTSMDPSHHRTHSASTPPHSGTGTGPVSPYAEFLIDGAYVATLRAFYRAGFDGLVRKEDADTSGLSLAFCLGDIIVSDAALAALTVDERWVAYLRHSQANWGNVGPETAEANFQALQYGGELRSAYHTPSGVRFTIITNSERTRTSIQLEDEPPA